MIKTTQSQVFLVLGIAALSALLYFTFTAAKKPQEIRQRAAVQGGSASIQIAPPSGEFTVGVPATVALAATIPQSSIDGMQMVAEVTGSVPTDFTYNPVTPTGLTAIPPIIEPITGGKKYHIAFVSSNPTTPLSTNEIVSFGTFTFTPTQAGPLSIQFDTTYTKIAQHQSTQDILNIPVTNTYAIVGPTPTTTPIPTNTITPTSTLAPTTTPTPTPPAACIPQCGDGICQEITCTAAGCACAEDSTTCPVDCHTQPTSTLTPTHILTPTSTKTPTSTPTSTNAPTPSVINIFAAGAPSEGVYPTMNLKIDGAVVRTWKGIRGNPNQRIFIKNSYTFTRRLTSQDSVEIGYTDDIGKPSVTGRKLRVDRIVIDGQIYQSEDMSVYSTGTFTTNTNSCSPRYAKSEWLHCNGYFQYTLK